MEDRAEIRRLHRAEGVPIKEIARRLGVARNTVRAALAQTGRRRVNVPAAPTGRDPAKKVPGRKRGLAVDVLGLVIAVVVMAAGVHDNRAGTALLD